MRAYWYRILGREFASTIIRDSKPARLRQRPATDKLRRISMSR